MTKRAYSVQTPASRAASRRGPPPQVRVGQDRKGRLTYGLVNGADPEPARAQLRALFGTTSDAFAQAQLDALFKTLSTGLGRPPMEAEMNSAIALVAGVEPQNEVEGALATQMAVVHAVSLRLAGRLMSTDPLHPDFASAGNIAAKFFRAFGRQVEALVRLRRPTAQLIRVERLNINEGANAIVGTVTTRKGGGELT